MKDCLIVRGVSIGAGRPKIIAPIMGRTMEELEMQARQIARARADVAEWRADAFEGAQNEDETRAALRLLRDALGEKPILYTVRTRAQGGEIEMSPDLYKSMTLCAARSGLADLIDVEIFARGANAQTLVAQLRAAGALVVGSHHEFARTPPLEEMIDCLEKIRAAGCDVLKLAVMPRCPEDVLALLSATARMRARCPDRLLITMAMGALGAVSRVAGETFGSCMTFGCVDLASAPGQLPVDRLCAVLDVLHESLSSDSPPV